MVGTTDYPKHMLELIAGEALNGRRKLTEEDAAHGIHQACIYETRCGRGPRMSADKDIPLSTHIGLREEKLARLFLSFTETRGTSQQGGEEVIYLGCVKSVRLG